MNDLGVWLQPVSHWLVARLISRWWAILVMIGTLALAGSAAAYLTSAYDHQPPVGGSVPGAATPVPIQSLCTPLVIGGALAVPGQCSTVLPAQSPCIFLMAGSEITCTDLLPAVSIQCTRSVPAVAFLRAAVGRDPLNCAFDLQRATPRSAHSLQ
jgi:hypothetical protein